MAQTGTNLYAALKWEGGVIGVLPAAGGTLAKKFPINRQGAPRLAQALIRPGAITGRGQRRRPRGGSHSVTGSLTGDLTFEHDAVMEAAVRGTFDVGGVLVPGVPLVRRSATVEIFEADADISTLNKGCRIGGLIQRGAPDAPITHEYPLVGITQEVRTAGAAPYYTTPVEADDDYMTTTDCVIEIDGTPVVSVTGWEVNLPNGAATIPIVGGKFSPDVFDNDLDLTGSISMVRETAALQQAYIANTPLDLAITAVNLNGDMYEFLYPDLFLSDFTQPLGEENAMIITIPFVGGSIGNSSMVQITKTAAA